MKMRSFPVRCRLNYLLEEKKLSHDADLFTVCSHLSLFSALLALKFYLSARHEGIKDVPDSLHHLQCLKKWPNHVTNQRRVIAQTLKNDVSGGIRHN